MAHATAYVEVTLSLDTRRSMAALMLIRQEAESIIENQPWNDEAKNIARLAKRLLRQIKVRRKSQ